MRILQISSASSIGGGERHVVDLSNSLAERGHDVYFALQPSSPMRVLLVQYADEHFCISKMRNAADIVSASEIGKFARRIGADIIHAHIARDYVIAAEASRVSGVPFVLTRHVLFPMSRVHRLLLRRASGVIAPSRSVYDALVKDAIFPAAKIALIYNGVDIDHFSASRRRDDRPFTAGTVGHIAPIKGLDIFVRAAALAAKRRPDIRFVIVGEDKSRDGRNLGEITDLIAELGVEIDLDGWTDDIRSSYGEMDIFVSGARSEPFGLVIAEAMASGTPVIATRSEGASEIIEDGVSGVIVPLEDPASMANAILELASDRERRIRLAQNARQRVVDHFSLENMASETEALYEKVLNGVAVG